MVLPTVAPRVKETHERSGLTIERAHVAPLPCIASKAGESEIIDFRGPAMLAADDMVYLVWRIRIFFMKKAVLTDARRALQRIAAAIRSSQLPSWVC
jgi:hypothetical protein